MTFFLNNPSVSQTIMLLSEAFLTFLKIYNLLITIRLTIAWFPNFNPYTQPFALLIKFIDPYLRLFRGILPSVFGIDFSPLLSILWIQALTEFFTNFKI